MLVWPPVAISNLLYFYKHIYTYTNTYTHIYIHTYIACMITCRHKQSVVLFDNFANLSSQRLFCRNSLLPSPISRLCIYVCVCMRMYANVCVWFCTYIVHVRVCICLYACIYIYICLFCVNKAECVCTTYIITFMYAPYSFNMRTVYRVISMHPNSTQSSSSEYAS